MNVFVKGNKLDAFIEAQYAIYVEDGHYLLKNSTQMLNR